MNPVLSRLGAVARYMGVVGIALIVGIWPRCVGAQPAPEQKTPLAYSKPPRGAQRLRVDHIQGQVVFAPAPHQGWVPAPGVRLALFNAKQTRIAAMVSGEGGQFTIPAVAPGAYTLVVGEDSLHLLSIPLLFQESPSKRSHAVSALLLRMRSKTDRRPSVVTPIANMALRAQLLEMLRKDQAVRKEQIAHGVDHPDKQIEARMAAIDAQNLARMQQIVRKYGWPGPDLVGVDGTEAAFILVQHSPLAFQKQMLPRIRSAYRRGDMKGEDYALLLDRVLVREGKPQVYGTQAKPFAAWKNREPALEPIRDAVHVDQRRAEVGLFPLADYVSMLKQMYFPTEKGSQLAPQH